MPCLKIKVTGSVDWQASRLCISSGLLLGWDPMKVGTSVLKYRSQARGVKQSVLSEPRHGGATVEGMGRFVLVDFKVSTSHSCQRFMCLNLRPIQWCLELFRPDLNGDYSHWASQSHIFPLPCDPITPYGANWVVVLLWGALVVVLRSTPKQIMGASV